MSEGSDADAIWPILTYSADNSFLDRKTTSRTRAASRWDDAVITFFTPYLTSLVATCTTRGKDQIDGQLEPEFEPTPAPLRNGSLHRAPLPELAEASAVFLKH